MKKRVISILLSLCLFAGFVPSMQLDLNAEAKTEAMTEDVAEQYLSDLEWSSQSCGASKDFPGGTVKDASINGGAMVLLVEGKETSFNKGLGAHAPSEIVYDISDMGCTKFEAYASVDYQCFRDYQNGEAIVGNFIVEIDGVQVAQSGEMNPAMDAYHFVVDVPEGAEILTLKAQTGPANDCPIDKTRTIQISNNFCDGKRATGMSRACRMNLFQNIQTDLGSGLLQLVKFCLFHKIDHTFRKYFILFF